MMFCKICQSVFSQGYYRNHYSAIQAHLFNSTADVLGAFMVMNVMKS